MLAEVSNTFNIISKQIKWPLISPKKEFLCELSCGEERQQWKKAMDGYSIGKILVDLGAITPKQLDEGLERQRKLQSLGERKSLGVLLVEMGFTTSKTYLEELSQYFNIPVISLINCIPIPSMQKLIGLRYACRHKVIVVRYNEDEIKLALAEPNPLILEELKKLFRSKKVNFYLANPFEVERSLRRYSDPYSENFCR